MLIITHPLLNILFYPSSSSVVLHGVHGPTGTPLALKIINTFDKSRREQLIREIAALYVNYAFCKGYVVCLEGYSSVILLSFSISSGAPESPGLLPSYSMKVLALHVTIILIITHLSISTPKSTLNHISTDQLIHKGTMPPVQT